MNPEVLLQKRALRRKNIFFIRRHPKRLHLYRHLIWLQDECIDKYMSVFIMLMMGWLVKFLYSKKALLRKDQFEPSQYSKRRSYFAPAGTGFTVVQLVDCFSTEQSKRMRLSGYACKSHILSLIYCVKIRKSKRERESYRVKSTHTYNRFRLFW